MPAVACERKMPRRGFYIWRVRQFPPRTFPDPEVKEWHSNQGNLFGFDLDEPASKRLHVSQNAFCEAWALNNGKDVISEPEITQDMLHALRIMKQLCLHAQMQAPIAQAASMLHADARAFLYFPQHAEVLLGLVERILHKLVVENNGQTSPLESSSFFVFTRAAYQIDQVGLTP